MEQTSGRREILMTTGAFLLLGLIALLGNSGREIAEILQMRFRYCLEVLVPSLFACMVAGNLAQQSGAVELFGKECVRHFRRCRIPASFLGIFVISQLAGYPVGCLLLKRLYAKGEISLSEGRRMSAVCFGGGPSFCVGLAGAQLFGDIRVGWYLWGYGVLGNLCLLLFLRPSASEWAEHSEADICRVDAQIMAESVGDAMKSLFGICGVVLLFGVVTWLLSWTGVIPLFCTIGRLFGIAPHQSAAFLGAFFDITQLSEFCRSGISAEVSLPIAAGLLSFGGVCVCMQCKALCGELIDWRRFFRLRILVGIFAAGFAMLPFLFDVEIYAVPTFLTTKHIPSMFSPYASLLIFLTGFPLIQKKD